MNYEFCVGKDRCHRIGQNKTVTVYRLVALDTVDEDIFEIGEEKRKLTQVCFIYRFIY